ncbi:MAG: DUF1553 domain-containing protein, partial [Planctomycetales bacterium]|nr:DUF1553 domain-containing protein [Planctomycetales bacterium]
YPMLMTFDSPDSTECTARRTVSNTPLQALTLWNDPAFFECAQQLGRRVVEETAGSKPATELAADQIDRDRIAYLFRLTLARDPSDSELKTVARLLAQQQNALTANSTATDAIIGATPVPASVDKSELAAWIMVGRAMLNLDEFISKE